MRRTTPVLAFSTILAAILFAAAQHPAHAACTDESSPGCNDPAHPIGRLAEAGERRGYEELRGRDHDFPSELLDKVKVLRMLGLSPAEMEEATNKLMDVVHRYAEAEGHVRESEKKIRDADDAIDKAKSDKIAGEAEKRAAEEERSRQLSRFVFLLEDSLHQFRPPPPPREPPRWRPHRVFWHHFREGCLVDPCGPCGCWPERRPEVFPLIPPALLDRPPPERPWPERDRPPPERPWPDR